ncbi:SusD/RagB family nutrient-binding outer membrane lipoprotein [Portibacter lacus]|uniref:SusD/RagB family nutrient-binding outer membrane lipoprotein n=1 Tax=Portibacter lacus TaxID=1099794 RepID=A0AA37SQM8_9BACT|nr:SusD/RagB family nutrient-binding outer membrane lipoprotein [Portibacter lacus]GLR17694.1 hypothetical protein GCM10007940_23090 [Portibacter lacus]
MNFKYIMFLLVLGVVISSCTKEQFEDAYADPEKVAETSIERQYTGFLNATRGHIVPNYNDYFENLRITLNPWTQSISWINTPNQYIPGSRALDLVWNNYYAGMRQYREFEKVFDASEAEKQTRLKVFKQTADIHFFRETAKMIDLYENIPFFEAGRLSQNGGDYDNSYPAFDLGPDIYAYMLDELKVIADDFAAGEPGVSAAASLKAQDFINYGDFDLWKRYANSLRLRMLNRLSLSSEFSSRATSEMAEILGNPSKYPVVENNDQNIMIDIYDINSAINSGGFNGGINSGGWDGDDAPKAMIDYMNESEDPRLRVLFEPGDSANGEFIGIDPLLLGNDQNDLRNTSVTAFYNRTTTSRNQSFPGVIINAPEVNLIKAEYYLKAGDDAAAKEAYETAIKQSTDFYFYVNSLGADRIAGEPTPVEESEFDVMFATEAAGWDNAGSQEEKIELIASQKWVHFNIIQPYQNWAEIRRLDYPVLEFWVDNSSLVKTPPLRFNVPGNEQSFNKSNYEAISGEDELFNPLFWDVN